MKTIVVSGAHSNVGKTGLARELCALLPGARHVKIGHGKKKEGEGNIFYPAGTPFSRIAAENARAPFLVVESNSVLAEMSPECTIYLPGGEPKASAVGIEERADIVRGRRTGREAVARLGSALGLPEETVLEIIALAGSDVERSAR